MIARITEDGLWRVTYGELPGLTFEQLKERQPMKFKMILPGNPDPGDYDLANFSPYKVHQRIANKMRVGRILLAADAAHCMSPLVRDFASHHTNV
jgi:2-polyprenyl-6-methoxyphenol hydroxylase-like FAD-dependent oxidoreductase